VNVTLKTLIPTNFNRFLAVDDNKEQLFNLISRYLVSKVEGNKVVICTVRDVVCTNSTVVDISTISPCNAEEADGRLLLHPNNAVKTGLHHVTIRTIDSML